MQAGRDPRPRWAEGDPMNANIRPGQVYSFDYGHMRPDIQIVGITDTHVEYKFIGDKSIYLLKRELFDKYPCALKYERDAQLDS